MSQRDIDVLNSILKDIESRFGGPPPPIVIANMDQNRASFAQLCRHYSIDPIDGAMFMASYMSMRLAQELIPDTPFIAQEIWGWITTVRDAIRDGKEIDVYIHDEDGQEITDAI